MSSPLEKLGYKLFNLTPDEFKLQRESRTWRTTKPTHPDQPALPFLGKHHNPTSPTRRRNPTDFASIDQRHSKRTKMTQNVLQGSRGSATNMVVDQDHSETIVTQDLVCRRLYVNRLHYPSHSSGFTNQAGHRHMDIFWKGNRIIRSFANANTISSVGIPIVVHYCIVQARCKDYVDDDAFKTDLLAEFWTDHGATTSNQTNNFSETVNDTQTITEKPLNMYINKNNMTRSGQFKLLYRTKRLLMPKLATQANGSVPHVGYIKFIDKYFKTNRTVRFHDTTATGRPEWPVFEVYWIEPYDEEHINSTHFPNATGSSQVHVKARKMEKCFFKHVLK